jgi:hypothetical protein
MNIKFNYLYRDAGNYKTYGFIIFSNPDQLDVETIEGKLRASCIDSEFFNPTKFQIPILKHVEFNYNPELDHSWNEFESVETANEKPTDSRTISEFIKSIENFEI